MYDSYVMIDPIGRLFQNTEDGGYRYRDPIQKVSMTAALVQTPFHPGKFQQRYVRG